MGDFEARDNVCLGHSRLPKAEELIVSLHPGVVATAQSLEEAEEVIPTLGELGVQVAIVNGSLGSSHGVSDGTEGALVVSELRAVIPGIKIIGATYSGKIEDTDVDIIKTQVDPLELNETIAGF